MTTAQLQTIKEIFYDALDCEPDRVTSFLETACQGDEVLRREVESFLTAHQQAGNFIEASVVGLAANIIEKRRTGLLVGQTIGHYKISKRIDAGGMGEVYLASDITAGRKAALKLLPAHLVGDAERLKRFQQEARIIAGLNHPNILTIYEVGADNSTRYIASELVEGETLRRRLAHGNMQVGEVVEVAIQVAAGLAAAHSADVIHRDIKPENIMLRPDGYVKVLDFGIAKLAEQELPETIAQEEAVKLVETNLGAILGTVSYMSPEQARGAPVDKRTDIWSLGVVLYEMAVRRRPFTGNTPAEVMGAILAKEPSPLSSYTAEAPDELQQVVTKALQKNPAQRYQSAREMLEELKGLRHRLEFTAELKRSAARRLWLRWIRSPTVLTLILLLGALALAFPFYWLRNPTTTPVPEKSVAVLPFENLSDDEQNAYFAAGVQDEITSTLARIAELKVISRNSANFYKSGIPRNSRAIGQQLGVAHLLEASVQRIGNRLRINAQLIDTRTDTHVWAQTYDRDVSDLFAIQREIAQAIAGQLYAKISPAEELAIERAPTTDLTAFDLYTRAKDISVRSAFTNSGKKDLLQATDLLNQALARDPAFFLAYCQLAFTHDYLYFFGHDRTPARLALAEAAIQAAFRLRPDAGEAHLARAENLYRGYLDHDGALAELEVARRTLPNDAHLFHLRGSIERRRGHWEEAIRNIEHAVSVDPRNIQMLQEIAASYGFLRRYAEAKSTYDRAQAIDPNYLEAKVARAAVELAWKADTRLLHQLIDSIRSTNPAAIPDIANTWFLCGLAERDPAAAKEASMASGQNIAPGNQGVHFNQLFVEGIIARMTKDDDKAQSAFTAARAEQEKIVQAQPNYGPPLVVLGLIDAALGRREEALREGRRAVDLLPVEKDSINGQLMIEYFAMIAAWVGEKDLACQQLAIAVGYPGPLSYGELKLLPFWDPLRGDPCFEQIVASLAPK